MSRQAIPTKELAAEDRIAKKRLEILRINSLKGLLDAFAHQVRLVRGHFGCYEPIDFLALLVGYAISGERTLADFFERLAPFGPAFMALDAACQPSSSREPLVGSCLM